MTFQPMRIVLDAAPSRYVFKLFVSQRFGFVALRCGEQDKISLYFGSKKRAYHCQTCGCLFWQDGDGKPYPVNDCD